MSSQYESKALTNLVQRSPAALFALGVVFALMGVAAVALEGGTWRYSAKWIEIAGYGAIVIGVLAAILAATRMASGRSGG